MGNSNKKSSGKDLLDFIYNETRKWNEILAKVQGQTQNTDLDSYIYNEFQSSKGRWKKRGKSMKSKHKHNYYGEKDTVIVHVEDMKRLNHAMSNIISENARLKERHHYLEMQLRENDTTISNFEQCISDLNQRRHEDHAISKPVSVIDMQPTRQQKQLEHSYEQKIKTLQKTLMDRDDEINTLKSKVDRLRTQHNQVEEEKNDLLLRLSKLAGDRLVVDNPAITDLSDPNRPMKLGESFSELYDNEWTNAIEVLQKSGYAEEMALETLRLTLMNIYEFSEKKASMVLRQSTDAVNLLFEEYKHTVMRSVPAHLTVRVKNPQKRKSVLPLDIKLQQRWKSKRSHSEDADTSENKQPSTGAEMVVHKENLTKKAETKLIQLRKEVAVSMVPIVQEAYIEASWDPTCLAALRPFIMQTLFITWMMVVQSPPMVFQTCEANDKFDTTMFKDYTKRGSKVDFMVWPALLLEKDGPVVMKGVAQGKGN